MKKNNFVYQLVLIVLGLSLISCNSEHHKEVKAKFLVTNPWRKNIEVKKEYVAQIRAIQHIELRAFESGYLQSVFVDEGQMVKKGQKMFQIMPMIVKAEYQKAKAEYDVARIEYQNTKSLAKRKVVSKNELALSKAKFDKAKAELDLAQTHLDFTTITAPFDGLMDRFHVRLGSLLDEGELLTTLSDNSQMWVYFNVSETDYLDYMAHKDEENSGSVKLVLASGEIFSHEGKIDTIEADFNSDTGNVAFRASFPNPEGLLRHGQTGNILLTEPIENAMVIPQKATFEILDKKFVYVIDKDNKVSSRQIEIAEELPHLFVVASGLEDSDKILLEGLGKVKLGEEIDINFLDPSRVIASLDLPVK